MKRKCMASLCLALVLLFSGCSTKAPVPGEKTADTILESSEPSETVVSEPSEAAASEPEAVEEAEPYRFDPHLYSDKIGDAIPRDHYEALYHLIDAARKGKDTFECSSEEAYKWATESTTLNDLFPAACMKITGESQDGSKPFENGIGRIYYNMPAEDFVKREAEYEAEIEDVLNQWLEPDDNDFEKCIKLYDYMESTFTYGDVDASSTGDGADYKAFRQKTGVCDHIASIYAYLLMQAGVDALNIGIFEPDMCHAWTYVIVDGEGYHVDATWALKSDLQTDQLYLDFFMMSDERREETGCKLDDITAPLLPEYWASYYDSIDFKAPDKRYDILQYCTYKELDEDSKILYYYGMDSQLEQMNYA